MKPSLSMALGATTAIALCLAQPRPAVAESLDRTALPIRPALEARVGQSPADSQPGALGPVRAPADAPNIVLILMDDVGFSATSTFGGPTPTPSLDRLAARGLRYNNFHTTAICSPTRAALLTGRNHHAVGHGHLADLAAGYPGYDARFPASAATIARVLRDNGYSTAFFGKHHNAPGFEPSGAGPFDDWPTRLGFDHFYGFVAGDIDQFRPRLFRGTDQVDDGVETSKDLLDKRMADEAIRWVHNQDAAASDKPFLLYWAPGSTHAPHQAPPEWIARFKGKFDQGWDRVRVETLARQKAMGVVPKDARLTPRPAEIPAWDSLSPQLKRVYARQMEVCAAQLAYFDAQVGRMLDELQRMGELDNTLVVFIAGDNGASAEAGPRSTTNELGAMANRLRETDVQLEATLDEIGGPRSYGSYATGWAHAMDTPFPWFKQVASHLGGTRNGMVVSWPSKIARDQRARTGFAHVNDIFPTLLEAAGVPTPRTVDGVEQQAVDGVSLAPTFSDPAADNHPTQYFEIAGTKAIYHRGWLANTAPMRMPWDERPAPPKAETWEIYDLRRDFSQSRDLAKSQPKKLAEMVGLWEAEARRNKVYPVDDRPNTLRGAATRAFRYSAGKTEFTYWGGEVSVASSAAPSFVGRSFSVEAEVDGPADANGALAAMGSWFGGWGFYLDKGRPVAVQAYSQLPGDAFKVVADSGVPAGASKVRFDFASDGGPYAGGELSISIDGRKVGQGRIPKTIAQIAGNGETLDIGRDTGVPVSEDFGRAPFTGAIRRVDVKLGPPPGRPAH
jgi:arylsulfatase A-like enzyme